MCRNRLACLLLIPFGIHMVIGCGVFHGHLAHADHHHVADAVPSASGHSACEHHHSTSEPSHHRANHDHPDGDVPHRHQDCHDGQCVFDVVKTVELASLVSVATTPIVVGEFRATLLMAHICRTPSDPIVVPSAGEHCARLQLWLI